MMYKRNRVYAVFASALLLLAPLADLLAQQSESADQDEPAPRVNQLTLDDLRTFTDVFNQARRNYVESVDDKTLLNAAIRGMLSELDPHSGYLAPEEYEDLDDASRGRYSGIGINVLAEDRQIVVKQIINGSPADEAGLNPGDIITSVDGQPVKGRSVPDAINELDGEPGSDLTLTVLTPGEKPREVKLKREYIQIPTLSFKMLEKSYGYFKITQFHRESAVHLEQALESIAIEGTVLHGLVIDLRDNPGGVLQPAVNIADNFLNQGVIVTTRGRNATMQIEFNAHEGEWLPGVPVILLVDRGSASASEVLAGALQDHGRALVIGERTFGKGSVQSVLPLRNGGGIKLTTARYYTPSGRSIQAEGIVPDIVIDGQEEFDGYDKRLRESDLEGHLGRVSDPEESGTSMRKTMDFPVDEILAVLDEAGLIDFSEDEETAEPESGPGL